MVSYYEDTENQQSVQEYEPTVEAMAAENNVQSVQPIQPQETIQTPETVLKAIHKYLPLIVVSAAVVAGVMYYRRNGGK